MTPPNATLHEIVASIDAELVRLSAIPESIPTSSIFELQASFAALVRLLALTPPPSVRRCPSCGRQVTRDASRCGFCWTKLVAPVPEA
jgi:hypothetical protein